MAKMKETHESFYVSLTYLY